MNRTDRQDIYETELDDDLRRKLRHSEHTYAERQRQRDKLLFVVGFTVTVLLLAVGIIFLSGREEEGGYEAEAADMQPENAAVQVTEPGMAVVQAAAPAETVGAALTISETELPEETAFDAHAALMIPVPSWIEQDYINVSMKNRPGRALSGMNNVVIHWVGNPGTGAKQNRDYFEDLNNPAVNVKDISASAHFVVGLEGEIVQCVPINEVAFANYPRNDDTISIETCHPDWSGTYTQATYQSMVRLSAWLLESFDLTSDALIRHHDVSGKDCPKYFVDHPEAWEAFKQDVGSYMLEHPDIASEFP